MKRKKLIGSLLALLALSASDIPVQAQIDWVGAKADSDRFGRQLRRNQQRSRKHGKKRNTVRRQSAASRKVVERYPQVRVNGQLINSAVPATEIGGYTFVPFRDIFEALGATVNYDQQKRVITARRDVSQIQLSLPNGDAESMGGKKQTFRNGEAPFVRNGSMMVPLRMVSELMGDKVFYTAHPRTPQISIISRAAS